MKRARTHSLEDCSVIKRRRTGNEDTNYLSHLSHELILRILSFLPRQSLSRCQRVSPLFKVLAGDSHLWKALYTRRFIHPLKAQNRNESIGPGPASSHCYSRWLDFELLRLAQPGTHWQRRYKVRHNWARGICAVRQVSIADRPTCPSILAQMQGSLIFSADQIHGLRAWTNKESAVTLLAQEELEDSSRVNPPTSLAVQQAQEPHRQLITIGFEDGSFQVWSFDDSSRNFAQITRTAVTQSNTDELTAIAISYPYLATVSSGHQLAIYQLDSETSGPHLLYASQSYIMRSPDTISLTVSQSQIRASIAYPVFSYSDGWTVGIQEILIGPKTGTLLSSRVETASSFPAHTPSNATSFSSPLSSPFHSPLSPSSTIEMTPPTGLVYNHPHLLMSRADNTLVAYYVTSTSDTLRINPVDTLHGHTSAVVGAQIDAQGRAVSVSSRGDQLCIWDLVGGGLKVEMNGCPSRGEKVNNSSAVEAKEKAEQEEEIKAQKDREPSREAYGNDLSGGGNDADTLSRQVNPSATTSADANTARRAGEDLTASSPTLDSEPSRDAAADPALGIKTESNTSAEKTKTRQSLSEPALSDQDQSVMNTDSGIGRGWIGLDDENIVVLREQRSGPQALVVYNFA